jgi:hypothetical protein
MKRRKMRLTATPQDKHAKTKGNFRKNEADTKNREKGHFKICTCT